MERSLNMSNSKNYDKLRLTHM